MERPPPLPETSTPGVFAAGNVWHRPVNAVKRVASATGEGAIAIQFDTNTWQTAAMRLAGSADALTLRITGYQFPGAEDLRKR